MAGRPGPPRANKLLVELTAPQAEALVDAGLLEVERRRPLQARRLGYTPSTPLTRSIAVLRAELGPGPLLSTPEHPGNRIG